MEVLALVVIFISALGLESFLFNRLAFHKLDYQCKFSVDTAHEGDEIFLVETVHNKKFFPVPWLKVDIHTSRWLDYAGIKSVVAQDSRRVTSNFLLKNYQRTTRRWKLKCLKRGVFTIKNVTLITGDLFGFGTNSIPVAVDANLVVYPEILDFEELITPINYLQGDTLVRRWIIDDPFIISGIREYTAYDPMNRVHWGATAKEGRLMVRKNDFTSQLSLTIVLNIQSLEYEHKDVVDRNKIELGIKAAASLLDIACRCGMPVRFTTNGCTVDNPRHMVFTGQASGNDHHCALLTLLAKLELINIKDFEYFLQEIKDVITQNEVVIITCYVNEAIHEMVIDLKARNNHVKVVLLADFIEKGSLPDDIDIFVLSGVEMINAGK